MSNDENICAWCEEPIESPAHRVCNLAMERARLAKRVDILEVALRECVGALQFSLGWMGRPHPEIVKVAIKRAKEAMEP